MNNTKISQNRCDGLDILKCIAAYIVVAHHTKFPDSFQHYFVLIGAATVPMFMMITGYFYNQTVQRNRTTAQIKKIFLLLISSNVLYFLLDLAAAVFKGNVAQYFAETFTLDKILRFLLVNDSPFIYHIWYLGAMLYALVIVELLRKLTKNWYKILYVATPILLIASFVIGKLACQSEFIYQNLHVKNFLFYGIPYFTIGYFLNQHPDILSKFHKHKVLSALLVVLFIITSCIEEDVNDLFHMQIRLSTTLLGLSAVILFSNPFWNDLNLGFLKNVGRKYSLMIYIIHPLIIPFVKALFSKLHMQTIYSYIGSFIVFFASLLFGVVYYRVKALIMPKRKPKAAG